MPWSDTITRLIAIEQPARGQAIEQAADRGIDLADRGVRLRRIRAVVVAGVVELVEVQRRQARPRRARLRRSQPSTVSTRAASGTVSSNGCQRRGRRPPIAASLPGQNSVAVGRPAFSAPTQIGSPPHHAAVADAPRGRTA